MLQVDKITSNFPSPEPGEGCAGLANEVSLDGAGLGVVLSGEGCAKLKRLAPTPDPPRLGGMTQC